MYLPRSAATHIHLRSGTGWMVKAMQQTLSAQRVRAWHLLLHNVSLGNCSECDLISQPGVGEGVEKEVLSLYLPHYVSARGGTLRVPIPAQAGIQY